MSAQPFTLSAATYNERRPALAEKPSDIPFKSYLVSAKHISPYFSGFVEVRFAYDGIQFRYYGESKWAEMIPWHELAFKAGIRNEQYLDELRFTRQDAEQQGYKDGYAAGLEAAKKEGASDGR